MNHRSEWFDYYCLAYEYIENTREQVNQLSLKLQAAELNELDAARLKEENSNLRLEFEQTRAKDQGVREYQEEQLEKLQQTYFEALKERDRMARAVRGDGYNGILNEVIKLVYKKSAILYD